MPNHVYKVLNPSAESVQEFYHNTFYPFLLLNVYMVFVTAERYLFMTETYDLEFTEPIQIVGISFFLLIYFTSVYCYALQIFQILKNK
jgi:hypothetical protein